MATIAELMVRISAQTEGFQRGMVAVQRSMGGVERQVSSLQNTAAGLLTFAAVGSVMAAATQAADEQAAAQRRLSATSKLLGVDLAGLQTQAQVTAGRFQLSARVAQDFTGSMARLTAQAHQNNRVGEATAAWLNLAAANGISAEESMDALRLTILGQDEGLNKLGLANPSGIYLQWARAAGIAAGKMTDAQKAQALLDAVIHAGSNVRDAYSEWLASAAGQQSVLRARVEDSAASIGTAFNGIRVAVIPAVAAVVQKIAAFSGGIQILGADFVVGNARARLWAAQIRNSVAGMVQGVAAHLTGFAGFLDRLPPGIKSMIGLGGGVSLTRGLNAVLAGSLAGEVSAAQRELANAMSARDEVVGQILRDAGGFGNAAPGGTVVPPVLPATTEAAKRAGDAVDALADKLRDLTKGGLADFKSAGVDALAAAVSQIGDAFKGRAGAAKAGDIAAGQKGQDAMVQAAKAAGDALKGAASFGQRFAAGAGQMLAQFHPLNLAFQALSAVIEPLQPLLDALLVPFTIMGEIIGSLIDPVLRLLFQPLKYLGIVVSYIGEVIARVAGAIATAIGSLVRGIGRLVNKLPGSPGDPLVKAGQAMIDLGNQFKDAAKDMAAKRKELEGLSFDDALDSTTAAANRLTEALINAAQGFKIERFRFAASDAGPPSGSGARSPAPRRTDAGAASASVIAPVAASLPPVTININGATDPDSMAEMVVAALNRWALSAPHMRATVAGLTP